VDGILCENEQDISFEAQTDNPSQKLPADPGNYLFYLDVWLRHITVLEDETLREVALGGPDTTTRSKVVWQVKCVKIEDTVTGCTQAALPTETSASTGTLSAKSHPATNADNPCGLTTNGGYRRLQNQLYRVEIHRGSNEVGGPTYKWSRDNGSVVVKWQKTIDVDQISMKAELEVSNLGKDELLGFKNGNWIELIDDTKELLGQPGLLAEVLKAEKNILTIDISGITNPGNSLIVTDNARVRRWDSKGELPVIVNTWIDLEDSMKAKDGVQIMFGSGFLRNGDHWLAAGRTPTADIEWPKDASDNPIPSLPFGIHHHFAKLGILKLDATTGWAEISDCRNLFPPLTDLTSLYYVGGDGQEATPGNLLPEPLMVGVANGSLAVSGAKVKFEILSDGGSLNNGSTTSTTDVIVTTNSDGIASSSWTLASPIVSNPQVRASLLADDNTVMQQKLPVIFSASYQTVVNSNKRSCSVTVGDGGDFETLEIAINKTIDQTSLCLCLLPQPHKIGDLKIERKEFFKITGCGALITMEGNDFFIQSKTIVLQGTNIDTLNEKGTVRLQANEIYTDNCKFTSLDSDFYFKRPFLFIEPLEGPAVIHFKNNQISVGRNFNGIGLALKLGVTGWIENNTINGAIVLQYEDDIEWTDSSGPKIQSMLRASEFRQVGQMILHGNVLCNIITNAISIINEKAIFRTLIVSENLFQKNITPPEISKNSFASGLINFINNQFIEQADIVAFLVATKGIITGNIAIKDAVIRTFLLSGNVGVGVSPNLNLVSVV
jgi:hypothetical protein